MDKLWWNHITKANKFLKDIVASVVGERSVALSLPQNVPWRDTLLELVENQLKLENPKNAFEVISCPDEDIGAFLLNKYCKKEIRATYRYGMTYAVFLGKCQETVLNDRYIWVSDIPAKKYEEWLEFVAAYNQNVKEKTPAIFILETHDDNVMYKAKKGITKISFQQNIGAYDKFAFCALAASENSCKEYMRPYLAELVSTVCSEDIELCAECVNSGNHFLEDPIEVIRNIAAEKCRSNGEAFQFSKTDEEIRKYIWEVQLKSVFPIIEKYRSYFIRRYKKFIVPALPIANTYGEIAVNPEDVEIGTLVFMAGNGVILVGTKEYEELEQFRAARNKLAHLNILDPDTVDTIIRRAGSLRGV